MSPDLTNGCFEAAGALFILNHCRVLLRERAARGVSIVSTVFFTAWGAWNLVYYPSLGQWYSFYGGVAIMLANICWIWLLYRFRPTVTDS